MESACEVGTGFIACAMKRKSGIIRIRITIR
jgi:hypothetical protein